MMTVLYHSLEASYTGTATSYAIPLTALALPYGTHYWRVIVNSTPMPEWTLYVSPNIPAVSTPLAPANSFLTSDNTPDFQWSSVLHGNTYQIQIDDVSTFASPDRDFIGAPGELGYTAAPLANGKYYWRVRGINTYNAAGPWSIVWNITIDADVPPTPTLAGPAEGAHVTNPLLTLSWNASAGATAYELLFDDEQPFSDPIITLGNVLTYKPLLPLSENTYYWQVRAVDMAGNASPWSEMRSFTLVAGLTTLQIPTQTPPPEPTAELTAEPTAEPTIEPTAEPTRSLPDPSLTIVESGDPQVGHTGNWTTHDTAYASGGSYVYSSGSPDDALTLAFSGTRLDVVYVKHPALGTFVVEIDGTPYQAVDSTAADSEFGARVSLELPDGLHTVRVYSLRGTIAIDAFAVEAVAVLPPTVEPTAEPTTSRLLSQRLNRPSSRRSNRPRSQLPNRLLNQRLHSIHR